MPYKTPKKPPGPALLSNAKKAPAKKPGMDASLPKPMPYSGKKPAPKPMPYSGKKPARKPMPMKRPGSAAVRPMSRRGK